MPLVTNGNGGNSGTTTNVTTTTTQTPTPLPSVTTDAQQSVLGEIVEAFNDLGNGFLGLKNAFTNFGTVLGGEAQTLGTKMETSIINIKNNVSDLTLKLKKMGENLSNNFKL